MPPSVLTRIPLVGRFFRKANPTPDDVRAYWSAMQTRWNTMRINKNSAADMKAVAELLDLLGILDKQAFMKRFTTTISYRIYTPFEPGEILSDWPLWEQIKVCDHEHIHVFQERAGGSLGYAWNYITNPAQREHYEAEAYRSAFVLEWRYQGRMLDPGLVAAIIRHYGCSESDEMVMKTYLQRSIPSIKAGAIANDVTRWSVQWLDDRWNR